MPGGDSFSAPPLFLCFLFFFFFCREGVERFLFQSRKVFFFFLPSFFLSLDRKGRGLDLRGGISGLGGGRQDF